jgi:hypothetical protein
MDFAGMKERGVRVVVDGRRFWRPDKVSDAGLQYIAAGLSHATASSANGRYH